MVRGKRALTISIICGCVAVLAACVGLRTQHHSTSVVQYLYPKQQNHIETPTIPKLTLPIRVGIAFVPEGYNKIKDFTESDKMTLMNKVADHFKQYDFVESIQLIPSAYLQPNGSFANLDQIRTMYDIDVIALLSFDQTQFTDEGLTSITYWTLIGAYIVQGEKNATNTMVDAAVYDIPSRKMLFRAPGVSYIKSKSTPVNLSEQLRKDSVESFKQASDKLIVNLDKQLELFKQKVKNRPEEYQISRAPGYTGSGSFDWSYMLLVLLGLAGLVATRRHH